MKAETWVKPGGAEMAVVNNLKKWLSIAGPCQPGGDMRTETVATFVNRQMRDTNAHTPDL